MSQPIPTRDDYEDRLTDLGLREALGGKRPPDLSQAILAAAQPARAARRWPSKYALAACVLLSCGIIGLSGLAYSVYSESQRAVAMNDPVHVMRGIASARTKSVESGSGYDAAILESQVLDQTVTEMTLGIEPVVGTASPTEVGDVLDLSILDPRTSTRNPTTDASLVDPQAAAEVRKLAELDHLRRADEGRGPGEAGDRYSRIVENPFLDVIQNPLSTFSIDVDTASYAKTRRYLLEQNMLPPADAVRLEELINYFAYDYAPPKDDKPFAAHVEVAACPWQPEHRLVRIGLKGKEIATDARPPSNLVFLLDVSGSMSPEDKLPRVRRSMRLLAEQLGENDRVAIAVYAGASGLVLPSTRGENKETILSALERLQAGGSTNGASGIHLAYDTAAASFIPGGVNRVILCTDGDFNVGTTSTAELERLAEEKAKSGVFLTVLGFGMGNHNDDLLEKLADKGNGNYGYIDSDQEARKLLVDQVGGTLVTIAKDVKIQIEFNPRQAAAYRLIGYENRMLRAEDFNDDRKDAGEIGAGHTVTALYEIIPPGQPTGAGGVDPLKYQRPAAGQQADAAVSDELLTLKLRYKDPESQTSRPPLEFAVNDAGRAFGQASADFKFAASVASFGMLLRHSEHRGQTSYDAVLEIAQEGLGADAHGYRAGFLDLVRKAKQLTPATR